MVASLEGLVVGGPLVGARDALRSAEPTGVAPLLSLDSLLACAVHTHCGPMLSAIEACTLGANVCLRLGCGQVGLGIGLEHDDEGHVVVREIIPGYGAFAAGTLAPGDLLLAVDGRSDI